MVDYIYTLLQGAPASTVYQKCYLKLYDKQ